MVRDFLWFFWLFDFFCFFRWSVTWVLFPGATLCQSLWPFCSAEISRIGECVLLELKAASPRAGDTPQRMLSWLRKLHSEAPEAVALVSPEWCWVWRSLNDINFVSMLWQSCAILRNPAQSCTCFHTAAFKPLKMLWVEVQTCPKLTSTVVKYCK